MYTVAANLCNQLASQSRLYISSASISTQRIYEQVWCCPHASISKHGTAASSPSGAQLWESCNAGLSHVNKKAGVWLCKTIVIKHHCRQKCDGRKSVLNLQSLHFDPHLCSLIVDHSQFSQPLQQPSLTIVGLAPMQGTVASHQLLTSSGLAWGIGNPILGSPMHFLTVSDIMIPNKKVCRQHWTC